MKVKDVLRLQLREVRWHDVDCYRYYYLNDHCRWEKYDQNRFPTLKDAENWFDSWQRYNSDMVLDSIKLGRQTLKVGL